MPFPVSLFQTQSLSKKLQVRIQSKHQNNDEWMRQHFRRGQVLRFAPDARKQGSMLTAEVLSYQITRVWEESIPLSAVRAVPSAPQQTFASSSVVASAEDSAEGTEVVAEVA